MIFTHPNTSHDVVDGFKYTTATLSNGDKIVARFGGKTTFKRNGRRVTREQAFALVNADTAKLARMAEGDFRTDAEIAADMIDAITATRAARPSRAKMWAEVDTLARTADVEETVEAPAAPARPRMSDAQVAESRAAFRQFAELAAAPAGLRVIEPSPAAKGWKAPVYTFTVEEIDPASPAARLAQVHADIDAANKARLDAAFAASDARPDRLSTEGPEFETRRAAAFEHFPELAEASLVESLESRVDSATHHAGDRRVVVEAVDTAGLSGISATELVSQTVGQGTPATPRVIVAALALRMARQGWNIHQLGTTARGYQLAASVQPPYGGPIVAAADVIDGDLLATLYGPLGDTVPLSREAFIEAALTTARPA